jgi:uncharacterized protein YjbJ (UPF0337 family)
MPTPITGNTETGNKAHELYGEAKQHAINAKDTVVNAAHNAKEDVKSNLSQAEHKAHEGVGRVKANEPSTTQRTPLTGNTEAGNKAHELLGEAKQKATNLKENVQEKLGQAEDKAYDMYGQLKEKAVETKDTLKAKMSSTCDKTCDKTNELRQTRDPLVQSNIDSRRTAVDTEPHADSMLGQAADFVKVKAAEAKGFVQEKWEHAKEAVADATSDKPVTATRDSTRLNENRAADNFEQTKLDAQNKLGQVESKAHEKFGELKEKGREVKSDVKGTLRGA